MPGFEVIYTGLHQTPEQVVEAAIQEDVDGIGLSVFSGAHMTLFPRIKELLDKEGASDIVLFGGGTIPDEDVQPLLDAGVAASVHPGHAHRHDRRFRATRMRQTRVGA